MYHVDSDHIELLALLTRKTITGSATIGRRVVDVGPFSAALHETDDLVWLSCAFPWPSATPERFGREHIAELRRLFSEAGRTLRFEFFEPLHPFLAPFLQQHGFRLHAAQPLMLCNPWDLRPVEADDIRVQDLYTSDSDEVIGQYLVISRLCFNKPPSVTPQDIDATRRELRAGTIRSAYATVRGVMAGVGSISGVNDELLGIGTLAPFRGQGVASTVSSHLLQAHFRTGGPMAWLSAADDASRAVYQRVGFQTAGMQLNYIEADWDGRTRR